MAHSFVAFRGNYLLLIDSDIAWLAACLRSERASLGQVRDFPLEIDRMLSYWDNDRDFYPGPGCIQMELDAFLVDDRCVEIGLLLLDGVENRLKDFGDSVPGPYLNSVVGYKTIVYHDQPVSRLLGVIERFRGLVSSTRVA